MFLKNSKKKILVFVLVLSVFTCFINNYKAEAKDEPIGIVFEAKVYDPLGQMLVDNIKAVFKKDKEFTLMPRFGCPYLNIAISTMAFEGRDSKVCAYSEAITFVPISSDGKNEVYPFYIGSTVGVFSAREVLQDANDFYDTVKKILANHTDLALALRMPTPVSSESAKQ